MLQHVVDVLLHTNCWFYSSLILAVVVVLFCVALRSRRKWKQRLRNIQEQTERIIEEARNQAAIEVKTAQEHAKSIIEEEKHRSNEALQAERERIDSEKEGLEALDPKELMIKTVMALGGYGTRLDRLETQVANMLKTAKDEIMALSDYGTRLDRLETQVANMLKTAKDEMTGISCLISSMVNDISHDEASKILEELESLKWKIEAMDQSSTTYDTDDLMSKLDNIQWEIDSH